MTRETHGLAACPDCDLLQREPPLVPGGRAECARCGAELFRDKPHSTEQTLAFLLGAAIVFVFANAFPVMELDAHGLRSASTLFGSVRALRQAGMSSVAGLVLATAIVFPLVELAAMLYMLLPLFLGVVPPGLRLAFRAVSAVRPWGMIEVFLLGAFIAFVKLRDYGTMIPGMGLYAVGGFVMLLTAADAAFEPRAVWRLARSLAAPIASPEGRASP